MVPVNMPVVGQDIPTGIIKEWLKKEGDAVSRDEVIATVESEKATFDVEAPVEGILLKIIWNEEEEVKVLTPIAWIGQKGESFVKEEDVSITSSHQHISTSAHQHIITSSHQRIFISPLARRIAEKEGIEFSTLTGSGLGGRIIKRNILDALKAKTTNTETSAPQQISPPEVEKEVPFDRIRQFIADKLSLSKQTVPHFYLFADVEMDNSLEVKEKYKSRNIHLTITDLIIYAVGKAIAEFPLINSHVYSNRYLLLKDVNIGLAVSSDEGLRVPVITSVNKDNLAELAVRTKKIAADARIGKMDIGLKAGLTVTTLGMYGISGFLPIINVPGSAILAIGKSSPQVVTDGKSISIKNMMTITLACDHRLIDGAYGAQFLGRVKEILEQGIVNEEMKGVNK